MAPVANSCRAKTSLPSTSTVDASAWAVAGETWRQPVHHAPSGFARGLGRWHWVTRSSRVLPFRSVPLERRPDRASSWEPIEACGWFRDDARRGAASLAHGDGAPTSKSEEVVAAIASGWVERGPHFLDRSVAASLFLITTPQVFENRLLGNSHSRTCRLRLVAQSSGSGQHGRVRSTRLPVSVRLPLH